MKQIFKQSAGFYNQRGLRDDNEWNKAFRPDFSLRDLQSILTRDMPFDTTLTVELMGGTQSSSDLNGTIGLGRPVFMLNRLYIYQSIVDPSKSYIGINEVRLDPNGSYPQYKGVGIGKIFLSNCVHLCQILGISKLRLTAGREDGAIFWARHGFNIETPTNFWVAEENYQKIKDRLPQDVQAVIDGAFHQAHEDGAQEKPSSANRILASMDAMLDGVLVRDILYKGVEYRAVLDLNDADQMEAFKQSMKNIDNIRWGVQKAVEDNQVKVVEPRQQRNQIALSSLKLG